MNNPYLNKLIVEGDDGDLESVGKIVDYYYTNQSKQKELRKWFVERINEHDSTFLHNLAILGETELFKALLAEGVVFDKKDSNRNTPLYYALKHKNHNIAKILLKEDNSYSKEQGLTTQSLMIHQQNKAGVTPLTIASGMGIKSVNLVKGYEQKFLYDINSSRTTEPKAMYSTYTFTPEKDKYPQYKLNFQDVIFTEPSYNWIANPTGQIIDTSYAGEGHRLCSGINIGNDYYLTAGHCLGDVCDSINQHGAAKYKISFNYQHASIPKELPAKQAIQENLYAVKNVVEHGTCDSGIDYAVFKLEPNAQRYFGHADINADIPQLNEPVVISHHPRGLPKKISLGMVSGVDLARGKMYHTAHTLKGSSGAPIGQTKTEEVFGIHVAGNEDTQGSHTGVMLWEIAQKSKYVDKIGGFGLFKTSNAKKPQESTDLSYQFKKFSF